MSGKYENINYNMIVTQDLVCNSILRLHPGRGLGVVSSVRMGSLVKMVSLVRMVCLVRKVSAFMSKCKQLRPRPVNGSGAMAAI